MKPERLELEGFTAFRDRVELDFSGLDLFGITGPTGAGKSSLIDALAFALYGQVPRHGAGSVEPVIALGTSRARVRFEFSLDGESYSAARYVTRTPAGGATTSEARLERGEDVLASGAREVTRAVERLIGLDVDHFTRSVVLPQGEFAAFLHDPPAKQQELLTALLDLDVLEEVRDRARSRAGEATALLERTRLRLDDLADATEEAEAESTERVAALERASDRVLEIETTLADVSKRRDEIAATVETLQRDRRALRAISVPPGVDELAATLSEARTELQEATAHRDAAAAAAAQAREHLASHPSVDLLDSYDERRRALAEAREQLASIDLDAARTAATSAESSEAHAVDRREAASRRVAEIERRHAAHALAASVSVGDPCPVCRRPLDEAPAADEHPSDWAEAHSAVEEADRALAEARGRREAATDELARLEARAETIAETVTRLEEAAQGVPDTEATEDMRRRRAEAAAAAEQVESEEKSAHERLQTLGERVSELETSERRSREGFDRSRTTVGHLEPPPPRHESLAEDWSTLAEWAARRADSFETELAATERALGDADTELEQGRRHLRDVLAEVDVGIPENTTAVAAVASAKATAQSRLEAVRRRRGERAELEQEAETLRERAQVADKLARHLQANGFEAWLLEEAIDALLDGANELLAQLSGDAYSLAASGRTIEIVDHRNADERRSVRSLSGGETFLVSLALALSLGQRLLDLSERGGATLEAIFLDEGFGALDAETLDTVAAVVTELASSGRMVGVVTHVKDLADQIPVRFEVRPSPAGSTVVRSDR